MRKLMRFALPLTVTVLLLAAAPGCDKEGQQAAGTKGGAAAGKPTPAEPVKEGSSKTADGATRHVAALTSKGGKKTFVVDAKKNQLLELTLSNAPATSSPVDYTVALVDPKGREQRLVRDTNGSDGTTKLSTRTCLRAAGKHRLVVSDYGDDDVDPAGFKLTVRLLADPDKNEPNNGGNLDTNKALATPIKSGATVTGVIGYRGDEDWYKFEAKKNSIVEVELSNAPATSSEVDYSFGLWGSTGTSRAWRERDTNGADGTTVIKTRRFIAEAGSYYLQVFDWADDEYEASNPYKLTVRTLDNPDPTEPNSGGNIDSNRTLAKVLKSGETVEAMLDHEGDQDWFKITVPKGKLIRVKLTNAPASSSQVDYTIGLYDWKEKARRWRVRDTNGADGTTILETARPAPAKGDYFVQVYDWADDEYETSGKYKLTVTIADDPDRNEPNQGANFDASRALAKALGKGKSVTGYIAFHGDVDWFVIDHKGGELLVNLTNAPVATSAVDLSMKLYDGSNKQLVRARDTNGADGTTKLTLKKVLPAGKYYLMVYDWADDDFGADQAYSVCFGAEAKALKR